MKINYLSLVVLAALLLAGGSAFAEDNRVVHNGYEMPAYVEGEVIVKYKDKGVRSFNEMKALYHRIGVMDVKRFQGVFKNFEHLSFDQSALSVDQVVSDLERDPNVEYVQPNYYVYAMPSEGDLAPEAEEAGTVCTIPGIPFPPGCVETDRGGRGAEADQEVESLGSRPRIKAAPSEVYPPKTDPSVKSAWGLAKIGADRAWSSTKGSKNVIVAVIDSGVDYNHPDLAGNMWRNPQSSRVKSTGVNAAASSISGDIVGWDFVHNDNLPYDDSNHGTHVAGTIGAVGGNGKGISGVAQRVSILAVKTLKGNGSGTTSAAIKGIDYAISRGAKVLNNSWGSRGSKNRALQDAIARSERAGALFVAAAGNDGSNNDLSPTYPASYDAPNVISVAATSSQDRLANFSNYGQRTVHIAAPGSSIFSTLPGGRYGRMSGTSMATPHVSGAAALLWARFPSASYREIKQRLLQSGDRLSSLSGKTITGRRINLLKAMPGK